MKAIIVHLYLVRMRLLPLFIFTVFMEIHAALTADSGSCFRKATPVTCLVKRNNLTELCARRGATECGKSFIGGTKSVTYDNKPCLKWNKAGKGFTETHNQCMNPKGDKIMKAPFCYYKHHSVIQRAACYRTCEYIDTEECGGNRANDQKTITKAKDQYKCTHMLGAAYNVKKEHTLKTETGFPEDCCQMCKNMGRKCGFYTWRKGKCILFAQHYKYDAVLSLDVHAISGEVCSDDLVSLPASQVNERQKFIEKSGLCTYLPGIEIRRTENDHKFNPSEMNVPVGDCCSLCARLDGCLGYAWYSGTCYFRSSVANLKRRRRAIYVSGEVCNKEAFNGNDTSTIQYTTSTITNTMPLTSSHHVTKIERKKNATKSNKKGMPIWLIVVIVIASLVCLCLTIGSFLALTLAVVGKPKKTTKKSKDSDAQSISATHSSDASELSETASDPVDQRGSGSEESEAVSQDQSSSQEDTSTTESDG